MAGDATATGGDNGAPVNNNAPAGTSTELVKPDNGTQGFDPTTLTDADYEKVLNDPRSFTHPRFKALSQKAAEADKLKAERETAENARLADEKKYQELAQKHETSATEWQSKYQASQIDNKIVLEAGKLGITDLDAATKLLDRSGISVGDDGVVNGVEAAVKALADSKTYLVDKSKTVPTIGSSTNPAANPNDGTVLTFKASQIRDPAFYREHEKDILKAMKTPGAIQNDLTTG